MWMTKNNKIKSLQKQRVVKIIKDLGLVSEVTGTWKWTTKEIAVLNDVTLSVVKRIVELNPELQRSIIDSVNGVKKRPDILKKIETLKSERDVVILNDLIGLYLSGAVINTKTFKYIAKLNDTTNYIVEKIYKKYNLTSSDIFQPELGKKRTLSSEIGILEIELDENILADLKVKKEVLGTPLYSLVDIVSMNSVPISHVRRILDKHRIIRTKVISDTVVVDPTSAKIRIAKYKLDAKIVEYLKMRKKEVNTHLYYYEEVAKIVNVSVKSIRAVAEYYEIREEEVIPRHIHESLEICLREVKPIIGSPMYTVMEVAIMYGLTTHSVNSFKKTLGI